MNTDYEYLIYNSIVYVSPEFNLLKCCCCNVTFDYTDVKIEDHLESSGHNENIYKFAQLSSKFDDKYQPDYKNIFQNSIGLSLPSLLKSTSVNKFYSYCYICLKILSNGFNGINQHLRNGHKRPQTGDSFCNDCLVHLNNFENHIGGSDFHNCMINDLSSYGKEILEISKIKDEHIKHIPLTFKNISEYRSIFITLVVLEMKCQRDHARRCRIDNVEINWKVETSKKESDIPKTKQKPIGFFKLIPSDDEYFKIKAYDELVVYLDKVSWSMNGIVQYMPNPFEDDYVQLELSNNTGLKPEITFPYSITPKFSTTVFWRLRDALNKSRNLERDFQYLLLNGDLYYNPIDNNDSIVLDNIHTEGKLNKNQIEAIKMTLKNNVTLIHGPPGTGKTLTSIFIVTHLLSQNKNAKILVCAPSNTATDLLAERLEAASCNLVRLFSKHAENTNPSVKHLSLINLALDQDTELRKDYENYINKTLPKEKYTGYRKKFQLAKSEVLMKRQVTCTTLISTASEELEDQHYDYIVIDEASQSLEPETLLPIVIFKPEKVILVGDHMQLGPLVMSKKAYDAGFGISMFERFINQKTISSVMLNVQYRMNPQIALFPNIQFYESKLQDGITKEERTLNITFLNDKDKAVIFINHSGMESKFGESLSNTKEANLIIDFVQNLLTLDNIHPRNIGIITFYEGQNILLHSVRRSKQSNDLNDVKIANVDSFQGQEMDIIILSFVRSNCTGDIGFLVNEKRLNVALTRAKFKLIMFGNRATLEKNTIYDHLFEYLDQHDLYYEDNFIPNNKDFVQEFINNMHL